MVKNLQKNTKTPKDYLNIIKTGLEAIKISLKANSKLTSMFLAARFLDGLVPVALIWLSKEILNTIVDIINGTGVNFNYILLLLGISFAIATLQNFLITIRFFATSRLHDELGKYGQTSIMKHSLNLDMEYFESPEFFNQYEKVRRSIDYRLPNTVLDTGELLNLLTTLISVSIVLINISWLLLPLIIIINLPVLLWGMGYSMTTHDLASSRIPEARKADYLANLATDRSSIKEVKLFNLGDYLLERYERFFDKVVNENWANAKTQFSGAFFTALISDATYYGFYVWTAYRAVFGFLTVGDVALYIQAFSRASGSLRGMLRYINSLYENGLYITDYVKFMNIQPKIVNKEGALPLEKITHIRFDKVSFKYRPELPYVVQDLSFEISENENVALVGENGAGKTTIIKLLLRFYDVTEGTVYINGLDIREYKIEDVWRQIGTIFQDFEQYQMTAQENIAFGQINKINNFEEIAQAAAKSGADEFIEKLPQQYETTLGTRFEDATDLSLGQWQKIALSRAFIRESSVLILDEPTASLDAKAEYEIFKRFVNLVEGKITILISHRFSTVRIADKILVLDNGQIIEQGTHKELLEKEGLYAEMFNLQAEGYK